VIRGAVILGVIGGIGAGKSTVVRMLAECGAEVVDADAEAHEALEEAEVRRELKGWLGTEVFRRDGTVDRKAVAARVFRSPEGLRRLEALIHPRVRTAIEAKVLAFQAAGESSAGERLLVLDVPLLLDSPLAEKCDAILYVDAEHATRVRRVAERGWEKGELERRESFQRSDAEKRQAADHTMDNSGSIDETRLQVRELYSRLLSN